VHSVLTTYLSNKSLNVAGISQNLKTINNPTFMFKTDYFRLISLLPSPSTNEWITHTTLKTTTTNCTHKKTDHEEAVNAHTPRR
jgi:hypothetical protein